MQPTTDILLAVSHLLLDQLTDAPEPVSDDAAVNLLAHQPGISITELADQLGLTHSATFRLIDRLQVADLAERRPTTGRRLAVVLTRNGRSRARALRDRRRRLLDRALTSLDPNEIRTLTHLLARIGGTLARTQHDADRACRHCDQTRCLAAGCPIEHAATSPHHRTSER